MAQIDETHRSEVPDLMHRRWDVMVPAAAFTDACLRNLTKQKIHA